MSVNAYLPGQGIRSTWTGVSAITGLPLDPASPAVAMHLPDGSTTAGTPVQDSTGFWHADFVIPFTCPPSVRPGDTVIRWQSSGAQPVQNSTNERPFQVARLSY